MATQSSKTNYDTINDPHSALAFIIAMNDPESTYRKKILNEASQAEALEVLFEELVANQSLEHYLEVAKRRELEIEKWRESEVKKVQPQQPQSKSEKISGPVEKTKKLELKELMAQIKIRQKTIKHLGNMINGAQRHLKHLNQLQTQNNQHFMQNIQHLSQTMVNHLSGPNTPGWVGVNNQPINNQVLINAHNNACRNIPTPEKLANILGPSDPMLQLYNENFNKELTITPEGIPVPPPRPTLSIKEKKQAERVGQAMANQLGLVIELRANVDIFNHINNTEKEFDPIEFLHHLKRNPQAIRHATDTFKPILKNIAKNFENGGAILFAKQNQNVFLHRCDKIQENQNKQLALLQKQFDTKKNELGVEEHVEGPQKNPKPKNQRTLE